MGNCLFLRARGWGIDRQVRKKLQIPEGVPGGGMVTGRIEPCISPSSIRSDEGLTLETSAFHGGHSVKLLANLHIRALLTVKD